MIFFRFFFIKKDSIVIYFFLFIFFSFLFFFRFFFFYKKRLNSYILIRPYWLFKKDKYNYSLSCLTRAVIVRTRGRASNAKREAVRPTPRTVTLAVAARVRACVVCKILRRTFGLFLKKRLQGKPLHRLRRSWSRFKAYHCRMLRNENQLCSYYNKSFTGYFVLLFELFIFFLEN